MKNFFSKIFRSRRNEQLERIADALERLVNILDPDISKQTTSKPYDVAKINGLPNTNTQGISGANVQSIISYLEQRGIKVIQYHQPDEGNLKTDEALDKMAMFMGKNFEYIKDVYQRLKSTLNSGHVISMNIRHYPPKKISTVTQFLKNLKDTFSFLNVYNYKSSPTFQLTYQINHTPEALNFLSGGWFERYVKSVIIQDLTRKNISYQLMMNAKIVLPDGKDSELDIFFQVQDQFFWIETKTSSDHGRLIEKYSSLKNQLGIDDNHCALVILGINERNAQVQSGLYNINLFNIRQVETKLLELINSQLTVS